jgi:hypothetical protein
MPTPGILQKLIKQISASFARTIPQVMMRITNKQALINRFLNHRPDLAPASRFSSPKSITGHWSLVIGH